MKNRILISLIFSIISLTSTFPAWAGDLVVTRYFSGLWDQTHHESQGIMLQIIDQEDADGDPKAVAYWFTYGDDLEPVWYVAIGEVEGNQVLMDLYSTSGVGFLEADSESLDPVSVEGTLDLTFHNCNKGTASFAMDSAEGEFDIRRLAGLYHSRCSGGLSDNTPGDARPLMLEVELLPAQEGQDGKGKARFWERSDRMDLHVSVSDIPDGDYDIHYCGSVQGPLAVVDGEGATQFRSPEAEGKLLLTADPRDCQIDIQQGTDPVTVFLTSGENVLAEKARGPHHPGGPHHHGDRSTVEVDFENTGIIESAEGEVSYEAKSNSEEFEVEIKGVPVGTYGLLVAGNPEGDLVVTEEGEKAKLKFSDPQKEDHELLDFSPWDKIIEIRNGSNQTILEVTFPSE